MRAFAVYVLLLASAALAQDVAPAAPGLFAELLAKVATPEVIVTAALALLGFALGANAVRKRRVALATYHAFHIVEDAAAETEGADVLDKVASGLKAADDWMKANGWRPLKPGEQEVAKLGFTSLNGEQRAAVKVQAEAIAEASKAAASVP